MPNIKDKSTVEAIAREFTSNGRNKTEALRTIGYKDSYCDNNGTGVVYTNARVIEAIARIDADTGLKMDWSREENMKALAEQLAHLDKILKASPGNLGAIQARTAVIRECNASSGQHISTVNGVGEGLTISVNSPATAQEPKLVKEGA